MIYPLTRLADDAWAKRSNAFISCECDDKFVYLYAILSRHLSVVEVLDPYVPIHISQACYS